MKRLDLHLASSFARFFFYSTAGFLLLYIAASLLDEMLVFLRFNAGFRDAASLILARAPQNIVLSLPISTLIASVATVTIMTRNGETTALRSSGISLGRIGRPLLYCGAGVALLHLGLDQYVVPVTQPFGEEVRSVRIMKKPLQTLVRENNVWFRFGSAMIHAEKIRPEDKSMSGVAIYEMAGPAVARTITADRARWTSQGWVLEKVRSRKFLAEGGWEEADLTLMPYPVSIPPEDLSVIKLDPLYASSAAIGHRIETLRQQGVDVTSLKVEYWKKLALPLANLIMPFLAIPFAIRSTQRSGLWGSVAVALAVGFLFLGFLFAGSSIGKIGAFPPWLSAWFGDLVFVAIAFLLVRRAEKGA